MELEWQSCALDYCLWSLQTKICEACWCLWHWHVLQMYSTCTRLSLWGGNEKFSLILAGTFETLSFKVLVLNEHIHINGGLYATKTKTVCQILLVCNCVCPHCACIFSLKRPVLTTLPFGSDEHTSLSVLAAVSGHRVTWWGFLVCYLLHVSSLTLWITSAGSVSGDPCYVLLDFFLACLNQIRADWCWQK